MTLWHEIVAASVIGTDRQPPRFSEDGTALGALLRQVDGSDREAALLSAAAAVSLHQRAGHLPSKIDVSGVAPAERDERPVCSPLAAQHLKSLLAGQFPEALPEWLREIDRAGKRVPAYLLPELLALGRRQRELRPILPPVIGNRGLWLAAQNPEWRYLAGEESDESLWQTGTREERQMLLMRIRASDPARGRRMLEEVWGEEGPSERAAFLGTLQAGLSMDDEPFLEAVLDDRRKDVRKAAADLLARLPESRLCLRMRERSAPLLSVGRRLLSTVLQVQLPETCERAMERDGIEAKPPRWMDIGERAWWLRQIVSVVPPSYWSERFDRSPAILLQLASASEWRDALHGGWKEATLRTRDATWAAAFIEFYLRQPEQNQGVSLDPELAELLPPTHLEAMAITLLRADTRPLYDRHPALFLLEACRHPWSLELGRAVLASVRNRARTKGPSDYGLRNWFRRSSQWMPPELLPEASEPWPGSGSHLDNWASSISDFLSLLQFRHDMLKEIRR